MKLKKPLNATVTAFFATAAVMMRVFASTDNPLTGDEQGRYIWIAMAAAAASLVFIIIIAAISSKKGKK